MHLTPEYETVQAAANGAGARLFRLQYSTTAQGLWKLWGLHNEDVPCAVCQSTGSLATLMQPGNEMCPSGWSTEYTGFMMSAPTGRWRGEYVCVDGDAEKGNSDTDSGNNAAAGLLKS